MFFLNEIDGRARKPVLSSDEESAKASVYVDGTCILSQVSMFQEDGFWVIPGIKSIVQAHMLLNDSFLVKCRVEIFIEHFFVDESDTPVVQINDEDVIYTSVELRTANAMSAGDFCANYFMTHYKFGWITPGRSYYLNYYALEDESYNILYTNKNGEFVTHGNATAGTGVIVIPYYSDAVTARISMGSRTFTIYYLDFMNVEQLRFRNAFNAQEYISLPCSVSEEPKTEFDIAQKNGVEIRYDIEDLLELKIKTPLLPSFMYNTLIDMCRARKVERYDSYLWGDNSQGEWSEVNVKEYKFNRSNDPGGTLLLEMTITYCDTKRNNAITFT